MACFALRPANCESEMEEGEIIDEVDQLSDISSEEEFLLRQRLQVLENYNNVLERKQAKRTSNEQHTNGKRPRKEVKLYDLSEVSDTELEENNSHVSHKFLKKHPSVKTRKRKKVKEPEIIITKVKNCKKKAKQNKKKSSSNLHIKSSDDSDEEYFNKRRKLADAVTLKKNKSESSLKDRINRMLFGVKKPSNIIEIKNSDTLAVKLGIHDIIKNVNIVNGDNHNINQSKSHIVKQNSNKVQIENSNVHNKSENVKLDVTVNACKFHCSSEPLVSPLRESIDLCTDNESSQDVLDSVFIDKDENNIQAISEKKSNASSDEDLEVLREYALRTKTSKSKTEKPNETTTIASKNKQSVMSEDEDSDTAELRLICLKSTLLKKAIEMKQKQKLKKRLSQSSSLQEDFMLPNNVINVHSENNTDIESVDMDIGSDGEEKTKDNSNTIIIDSFPNDNNTENVNLNHQEDELEEDEDLLRAKLLTSLSKNLPNLVNLGVINDPINDKKDDTKIDNATSVPVSVPEEKKFIIKLGESDSEGEHEATKNLTKMHLKLAEHYQDFQSKLDTLLKSTRKEFEKDTLPDEVQKPDIHKSTEKFVPKAMNHLPKSEQIEYKNLVRRMAELEKIKQARSSLMLSQSKTSMKETLKPRNVSLSNAANNMEEKIALSRKKIAEESAKVLKLKEEGKKLLQKYKIVATELKNISTAINFNKKQQRAVHNNLQKIRLQHQLLLKGSPYNLNSINSSKRIPPTSKIQKENNPTANEIPYTNSLKSLKVSFVNDVNTDISSAEPQLSVQSEAANNKNTNKLPKNLPKGRIVNIDMSTNVAVAKKTEREVKLIPPTQEGGGICGEEVNEKQKSEDNGITIVDDYESPLAALRNTTWEADPNALLCPYEVGGSCRDPDCKYLHPKIPSQQ